MIRCDKGILGAVGGYRFGLDSSLLVFVDLQLPCDIRFRRASNVLEQATVTYDPSTLRTATGILLTQSARERAGMAILSRVKTNANRYRLAICALNVRFTFISGRNPFPGAGIC